MSDEDITKREKIKRHLQENKNAYLVGVGFVAGIATTLWCVERPRYNPIQPIPSLLLTEDSIKSRIAVGILFDLFVQEKELTDEFLTFSDKQLDALTEK